MTPNYRAGPGSTRFLWAQNLIIPQHLLTTKAAINWCCNLLLFTTASVLHLTQHACVKAGLRSEDSKREAEAVQGL
jgi:hypothetical protein